MPVRRDAFGGRRVELEVELPGAPEQVWRAIATGPGITSWFIPTDVEERPGGRVVFHIGPGADSTGRVTVWEPPRRFAYEEPEWDPNAPSLVTECVVDPKPGGTCVFRMTHSLVTTSSEWDSQLESFEAAWPSFFHVLRLYLTHFAGQRCHSIRLMAGAEGSADEAWERLAGMLGLSDAVLGERVVPAPTAPSLTGVVERVGGKVQHEVTVLLDGPAAGIAMITAYTWGGGAHVTIALYFYGEGAAAAAAAQEPLWRDWLGRHFPAGNNMAQGT